MARTHFRAPSVLLGGDHCRRWSEIPSIASSRRSKISPIAGLNGRHAISSSSRFYSCAYRQKVLRFLMLRCSVYFKCILRPHDNGASTSGNLYMQYRCDRSLLSRKRTEGASIREIFEIFPMLTTYIVQLQTEGTRGTAYYLSGVYGEVHSCACRRRRQECLTQLTSTSMAAWPST